MYREDEIVNLLIGGGGNEEEENQEQQRNKNKNKHMHYVSVYTEVHRGNNFQQTKDMLKMFQSDIIVIDSS